MGTSPKKDIPTSDEYPSHCPTVTVQTGIACNSSTTASGAHWVGGRGKCCNHPILFGPSPDPAGSLPSLRSSGAPKCLWCLECYPDPVVVATFSFVAPCRAVAEDREGGVCKSNPTGMGRSLG